MQVVLIIFVVLILVGIYLYVTIRDRKLLRTVTELHRGTTSEREFILMLLKSGIPAKAIFHDLYVAQRQGRYAQIDLIIATKVGLIVVEVKDYSGWIYGSGKQQQWTQVLAYGREKYRFYNPILQNNKHIVDLKKYIHLEAVPCFSVVVFFGNCRLKEVNFIPSNTYLVTSDRALEAINHIINNNRPFEYPNKREVAKLLRESVINGSRVDVQQRHVHNVTEMLGKNRIYD